MNKYSNVETALIGGAIGMLVGATVVYLAATVDIKKLEHRLNRSQLARNMYVSWLSKAIDGMTLEQLEALYPQMETDVKFGIMTNNLEK